MALNQPNMSTGKFAIRKIVTSPNGLPIVVYIDAQTGERLKNLNGYELIEPDNTGGIDINTSAIQDDLKEQDIDGDRETVAKKIIDGTLFDNTDNGGDVDALGLANKRDNSIDRNPSNNFGYRETPTAIKAASLLPGAIGMAGKVGRIGFGLNNKEAVGAAKDSIGLNNNTEQSKTIGNILSSVIGLSDSSRIANVRIGEKDYTVDFEALDENGRTALTPDEARKRGLLSTEGIRELTESEQQARPTYETNERKSLMGRLFNRDSGGQKITEDTYPERPSLTEAVMNSGGSSVTHGHISDVPDSALPTPSSRPSDDGNGSQQNFSDDVKSAAGTGLF